MHILIKKTLVILAIASGITLEVQAQIVKSKGMGQVVYKGFRPKSSDERLAIEMAKKNAVTRYAGGFDSSRFELYKKVENSVMSQLDELVVDFIRIDEKTDKTSKRYTVYIEASINSALIERAIRKNSESVPSRAATAASDGETYLTFVFVARELASRKSFDDKQIKIQLKESESQGAQNNNISEDGLAATTSVRKTEATKTTVGGSTEAKAAERQYRVNTVTEVDNAVNEVMTRANFEAVDPIDAGLDLLAFKKDFGTGDDISPATRRASVKICKENEISYLAVANMDVGLPEKDPNTGLTRVYVSVTAKVSDLTKRFPKTVASISGKPYAGLGSNPEVAKRNALNTAADKSAKALVDLLRSKGVK